MKSVMGLDGFILATTSEYDRLLIQLSEFIPDEAPKIRTVESNSIVTDDNYQERYS